MKDLEHWTAYLLPSRQFGYALCAVLVLSLQLCADSTLSNVLKSISLLTSFS